MLINFMCQLEWATGHTDTWSSLMLGASVRRFWVRLTSALAEGGRQVALLRCAGRTPPTANLHRRARVRGGEALLPDARAGQGPSLASGPGLKLQLSLGLPPAGLGLRTGTPCRFFWVCNSQTWALGPFLTSITTESIDHKPLPPSSPRIHDACG